jgi:hypothetical protein
MGANSAVLLHDKYCHKHYDVDHYARLHFVNYYPHGVHAAAIDPTLCLFKDEAWFHFSGYVNSQNNRYWSGENPTLIHEVPLHDVKVDV